MPAFAGMTSTYFTPVTTGGSTAIYIAIPRRLSLQSPINIGDSSSQGPAYLTPMRLKSLTAPLSADDAIAA